MKEKNIYTSIKISRENFWNLEEYRVLHKLSSKDEAIKKLIEMSKLKKGELKDEN